MVAARKKESELPILARAALWIEARRRASCSRGAAPEGLFGGLWELPQADDPLEIATRARRYQLDDEPVAYHDQTLTHRRLRIAVFRAAVPARACRRRAFRATTRIARVALGDVRALGVAAATTAILTKYEDTPWSSTPKRSLSSPRATTRSSKASRASASTRPTRTSPKPRRAPRKGFHELIHDQKQVKPAVAALLAKTFPAKYTEMVISKHNTAFGVCPHHLLPVDLPDLDGVHPDARRCSGSRSCRASHA